jgi:hypothetical protein
MARKKNKIKKLKRLYDQWDRFIDQPSFRQSKKYPNLTILTSRGKIEQRIQTLEKTK